MIATSDARSLGRKVRFDPDYLQAFEAKMFIEGPQTARRLTNFFVLLLLATVTANSGELSGSPARVFGAMSAAPLLGPIMATTAAVVMGSRRRALRSLALVFAGVAAVILLSLVLTWIVPDVVISFSQNGEIASRVSPGLYVLLTALGAGAAGAFIMGREEIADSMGGVAIAISLVPPLCVVGIALSQGEWRAASGAMLLFLTNFLAILLAGGLVFMLSGLGQLATDKDQTRMRRAAFALIVVATLLVAIPLSLTAYQVVRNALEDRAATRVTKQWLEGTDDEVVSVHVNDELVDVSVEGSGAPPPLKELADSLAAKLGHPVVVKLRMIPTLSETSSQN